MGRLDIDIGYHQPIQPLAPEKTKAHTFEVYAMPDIYT